MGKVCVGIDVGGTTVKLGLFEVNGQLTVSYTHLDVYKRQLQDKRYTEL